jgi:hypothetical protein
MKQTERKNKMEDLQLMYDVMQSSLKKNYDDNFNEDVSDVSKVLDWLREFELDNHDKIKFLNKWNR